MGRRNPIAKNLYSSKYKKKIVKPKKGKGSFKRKKTNLVLPQSVGLFLKTFLCLFLNFL